MAWLFIPYSMSVRYKLASSMVYRGTVVCGSSTCIEHKLKTVSGGFFPDLDLDLNFEWWCVAFAEEDTD